MQLDARFISLIYSSTKGEVSSGYLVADGIVLTCLHGLVDVEEEAVVPPSVTAHVFLNGDLGEQDVEGPYVRMQSAPSHKATMVWPPAGYPTNKIDIALLSVDNPAASNLFTSAISGAVENVDQNDLRGVAYGYSEGWRKPGNDTIAPTKRSISGRVVVETTDLDQASGRPVRLHDLNAHHRHLTVLRGALGDKDKWGGMSGAVIFSKEENGLFGVMKARGHPDIEETRLLFTPFSEVNAANTDVFPSVADTFWTLSKLTPPTNQPRGPTVNWENVLNDRFDELGRSIERIWFTKLTGKLRTKSAAPAHLFMIMGHQEEDLNQCVRLLLNLAHDKIPGGEAAYSSAVTVSLLDVYEGDDTQAMLNHVELRAAGITSGLLTLLSDRELEDAETMLHAERLEALREELQERSNPRALILEHSRSTIGDDCFILAQRLAAFLGTLPEMDPPLMVFLLVLTGKDMEGDELVEFEDKVRAVKENIGPRMAIDLTKLELGKFAEDAIEPIPQPSEQGWLADLAEQEWLPAGNPQMQTLPLTAGKQNLSTIDNEDMKRWLSKIEEVQHHISEHDRQQIIDQFQADPMPMGRAKEVLKSHPIFNK